MAILEASNTNMRGKALEHMASLGPSASVIDVGGYGNPWADRFVTAYVDIRRMETGKRFIHGDLLKEETWRRIGTGYDFAICTHVIEDIRDPGFVLHRLPLIAKAGFLAVPNKHTELSPIETPLFPGYCHHRWIFTLRDGVLRIMAKTAVTSHFVPLPPPWLDRGLVNRDHELGILWAGSLRYGYVNADCFDGGPAGMLEAYRQELAEGL